MATEGKAAELDLLFETSWEVCNKIGGIYTVLSTKAKTLQTLYKDKVVFIGPDVWDEEHPCPVFKEVGYLFQDFIKAKMLPKGVSVRAGRWMVPGKPLAILVKFEGMYATKDEAYAQMWEKFGVDSLNAYGDYDEGCAFARAAAAVIEGFTHFYMPLSRNVVAHFDEWTTAMGLLTLRLRMPSVATIFTTHATCIGRSICGNGKPLYDYFDGYNGDQMARELNMTAKHSLEKVAAHAADCFTTVSEVTARECEQLLERRPTIVTPNGFEGEFVPKRSKQMRELKIEARKQLLSVAQALTGKRYSPVNTFIVVTAGRLEYRNKGLDIFLDVMARLKGRKSNKKILSMVMVPAWTKGPRHDLSRRIHQKTRTQLPEPWYTHEVYNPDEDPVLRGLRERGIDNMGHVFTDTIYVPVMLDGNDGIFNRPYYDLLAGADATVFASYYEPWGYTPLESVAFGVPTITTSLSGFGQWALDERGNGFNKSGVEVVERTDSNTEHVVKSISETITGYMLMPPSVRAEVSDAARATAEAAAWEYFIKYYVDAFRAALAARDRRY